MKASPAANIPAVVWAVAVLMLADGCGRKSESILENQESPDGAHPTVYTTFYPTAYFAERIAGDRVEVVCPVPSGEDPAHWMPSSREIEAYQSADLILINGSTFEHWVDKVSLPLDRVVDTSRPLAQELLEIPETIVHRHGPEGAHAHEGVNPHTWLDPANAKQQANEIRKALLRLLPDATAAIEEGYAALAADLEGLDAALRGLGEPDRLPAMLCAHPSYDYLAGHYGWKIKNVALDPETLPDEKEQEQIRDALKDFPARFLVWEEQPKEDVASLLRKNFGIASIVFSPCELLSAEDLKSGMDYITVMQGNIANFRDAWEQR